MAEEKNRSFLELAKCESFRKFLKVNFFYCSLSQEKQSDYIENIGTTKFYDYLKKVQRISNGRINYSKSLRYKYKSLKYDISQFASEYNDLTNIFNLRTATALETCLNIFILCLLTKNPMNSTEIIEKIDGNIDEKTISNKIKSLCEYGLISYENKRYSIQENLLHQIDEELLLKLVNMTDFMKNIIYPETFGYNIFGIVKNVYEKRTGRQYFSPFQFKFNYLANVLDDNILWTLIEAIENRQFISFKYNNNIRKKIIPVKIFTENEYARRYLFAVKNFNDTYKFFIFRLSKIYDLKIEKEGSISGDDFENLIELYENEKQYSFFGKIDSSNEKHTIKLKFNGNRRTRKQLRHDFKCIKFNKDNTAEVTVKNKKMIIPYLRANMENIRTEDKKLSKKLKSEIEEMKRIYGIVP